jgi:hypothetical protein
MTSLFVVFMVLPNFSRIYILEQKWCKNCGRESQVLHCEFLNTLIFLT